MDASALFRLLPSVDELLRHPRVERLGSENGRDVVRGFVQKTLDDVRGEIKSGALDGEQADDALGIDALTARIERRVQRSAARGLTRVVNATGVVLHTGLGRAPVHPEVAAKMAESAGYFCTLEIDRESGQRGQRDGYLGELLAHLTGAETGIAVNNCAGAVLLTLQAYASGRQAVVSRGELVEIGGSFRIPSVMTSAGVELVEVGTTNRTRAADYRAAVGENTALLLKVHTSNFRVVGFTEEVSAGELAQVGHETGVTTAFDLGSGLLEGDGLTPLAQIVREPLVRDAVKSGVDLVMFSGDKLLGGPQAGLIVGKREAIARLRRNPVYRAVRCDKAVIAGLEATLRLILAGRGDEIPSRRMLVATRDELAPHAESLARALGELGSLTVEVVDGASQPGSGSAPGVELPSRVCRVRHAKHSAAELGEALRMGEPSVFTRIQDDWVYLDPRTLLDGDAERLMAAFRDLG